jgi:hypothetical protein
MSTQQLASNAVLTAREPQNLPGNKIILLFYSANEQLFGKLTQWAHQNDAVILHNPEQPDFESIGNLFAAVIDTDLIETLQMPEEVCCRLVPAELNPELIVRILSNLMPRSRNGVWTHSANCF